MVAQAKQERLNGKQLSVMAQRTLAPSTTETHPPVAPRTNSSLPVQLMHRIFVGGARPDVQQQQQQREKEQFQALDQQKETERFQALYDETATEQTQGREQHMEKEGDSQAPTGFQGGAPGVCGVDGSLPAIAAGMFDGVGSLQAPTGFLAGAAVAYGVEPSLPALAAGIFDGDSSLQELPAVKHFVDSVPKDAVREAISKVLAEMTEVDREISLHDERIAATFAANRQAPVAPANNPGAAEQLQHPLMHVSAQLEAQQQEKEEMEQSQALEHFQALEQQEGKEIEQFQGREQELENTGNSQALTPLQATTAADVLEEDCAQAMKSIDDDVESLPEEQFRELFKVTLALNQELRRKMALSAQLKAIALGMLPSPLPGRPAAPNVPFTAPRSKL